MRPPARPPRRLRKTQSSNFMTISSPSSWCSWPFFLWYSSFPKWNPLNTTLDRRWETLSGDIPILSTEQSESSFTSAQKLRLAAISRIIWHCPTSAAFHRKLLIPQRATTPLWLWLLDTFHFIGWVRWWDGLSDRLSFKR